MISQDGFFLPIPPNSSSASVINNNGFLQDDTDQNFIINTNNNSSSSSAYPNPNSNPNPNPTINPSILSPSASATNKRKRNLPGTPDPEAEVVALSPRSLMATNRFICEICNKGFQRDQNLQLHRRGHNLPWKLKQRANKDQPVKKKVYICPEKTCVHHDPSRALGDLTGIKKHFSRKHGEKKWKCDKCSKKYAVMSDWKAHSKICGTREYKCDCGTIFSRKDSFITHRAFCDALTEERMRMTTTSPNQTALNHNFQSDLINTSLLNTSNRSSISSFPTFNHSDSNLNKTPRSSLPLWLDHVHSTPQPVMNHHMDLQGTSAPSSSNAAGEILPEFCQSANLNLFAWPSTSSMLHPGAMLHKEEDHHHHDPNKAAGGSRSNYPQSLISLYNSSSSPCFISPPGNMSATALLQKAAQIGSTRSNGNSSVFANAFGHVMNSSSSSASLSNSNNIASNHNEGTHRSHHLLTHSKTTQVSTTTDANQLPGNNAYSSGNLLAGDNMHKYSSSLLLGGGVGNDREQLGQSGGGGGAVGMRDFLGTLGGGNSNSNTNSRVPRGERKMVSQDEHHQMGYNFTAMAAMGSTSSVHRPDGGEDAGEQEQYMDLMSQFNVGK